jgi:acetylornithine deacetylase/succinyl-diaminopimelate desuccinylase-like protein
VRAGFVVIGEQSALRVVTESKGICHARLATTGRAAHAAYPWLGENALLALTAGIGRLLARYPVPAAEAWTTTVNVARVETPNHAYNQVPAAAEAWLDIRYPPTDPDFAGRTRDEVAAHLSAVTGARRPSTRSGRRTAPIRRAGRGGAARGGAELDRLPGRAAAQARRRGLPVLPRARDRRGDLRAGRGRSARGRRVRRPHHAGAVPRRAPRVLRAYR